MPAVANEPTDADKALREKWQAVYAEIAQSIEMRRGETKLDLAPTPLLFYTNPVRATDQHGTMFLWTDRGRPAVIGSIWSALNRLDTGLRNITHEWHSLVEEPDVQAVRGGQSLWSAGEPGIAWQALAGSPAPASSRAARLIQLRTAARRFTASITAEEATELRLMPQPLYRYPEKVEGAADGALFVFALATDPELVLLLEQYESASQPAMRAAFARFGNLSMAVKDGERSLWTCERGAPGRSEGKYYLHWRVEQRPADLSPK
ncbi:MAG: hypothetical protein L0211_12635 [Planctomycetaceae bacterium]|nr:hypothetical protein [Planctomycetaceae bacterium]